MPAVTQVVSSLSQACTPDPKLPCPPCSAQPASTWSRFCEQRNVWWSPWRMGWACAQVFMTTRVCNSVYVAWLQGQPARFPSLEHLPPLHLLITPTYLWRLCVSGHLCLQPTCLLQLGPWRHQPSLLLSSSGVRTCPFMSESPRCLEQA